MGIMVLKNHVKNKTHEKLVQEQNQIKNFFCQDTILFTFQDGGKLNAEVRWVLKHVVSG